VRAASSSRSCISTTVSPDSRPPVAVTPSKDCPKVPSGDSLKVLEVVVRASDEKT
jgi:hypothetical protein